MLYVNLMQYTNFYWDTCNGHLLWCFSINVICSFDLFIDYWNTLNFTSTFKVHWRFGLVFFSIFVFRLIGMVAPSLWLLTTTCFIWQFAANHPWPRPTVLWWGRSWNDSAARIQRDLPVHIKRLADGQTEKICERVNGKSEMMRRGEKRWNYILTASSKLSD